MVYSIRGSDCVSVFGSVSVSVSDCVFAFAFACVSASAFVSKVTPFVTLLSLL